MRLRFLVASKGDPFLSELIELLAGETHDLGMTSEIVTDAYPEPDDDSVFVLVPHEFFELAPDHGDPKPEQLQRTVALCTAPPGETDFHIAAHYARQLGAVLHTHRAGCEELRRMGVEAEHFQLGYSARWDRWRARDSIREVDVLHIGARDAWRERAVAGWAPDLWRRHCRIVLPQTLSTRSRQLDGLLPDGRLQALRSARVLLCLHHRATNDFQWPLAIAAIANGCVLVSEHALGGDPLREGEHYIAGEAGRLAQLASELLDDDRRLAELRDCAYRFVRERLPLTHAVERLLDMASDLHVAASRDPWPLSPSPAPVADASEGLEPELESRLAGMTGSLRGLHRFTIDVRRRLERIEHRMASDEPVEEPLYVEQSERFAIADPAVSVIVPVYEYANEVRECLESVAASSLANIELLVLDDASQDGSLDAAREALTAHPDLAWLLLRHPVNRGVGCARNALIARARGEFVFVLDADNLIFPSALPRLYDALVNDPHASFAYPMQVVRKGWEAVDVVNAWPWDPKQLLLAGNYIDAMALIRRSALLEHAGYTEDVRIHGCEDYDLWCRMAEHGCYGVLVPEMLAVYRVQAHSKLQMAGGAADAQTLSVIRSRAPELMRRFVEGVE